MDMKIYETWHNILILPRTHVELFTPYERASSGGGGAFLWRHEHFIYLKRSNKQEISVLAFKNHVTCAMNFERQLAQKINITLQRT